MKFPNVHFRSVQLRKLAHDTPVKTWIETADIFKSYAMDKHMSDLVRLLLLYKYGGTYLDTDMMLIKNIKELEHNWIGIQLPGRLNNGIMDFRRYGVGHELVHECLR